MQWDRPGLFISVEGIDGAGKSLQAVLLHGSLLLAGYSTVRTRQPGGTEVGKQIREILLSVDRQGERLSHLTEFLLFAADRHLLTVTCITPHLDEGGIVICDRAADSSIAYQGMGNGLSIPSIIQMNSQTQPEPDFTVLLDLDPDLMHERLKHKSYDRYEMEDVDFMHRVRNGFTTIANNNPERFITIDATMSVELTAELVLKYAMERVLAKGILKGGSHGEDR